MNDYWDNLRPLEKRLVVAVGSVLFIVLNFWFVVPHFSDLTKTDARIAKARKTLAVYLAEISQIHKYTNDIATLQGDAVAVPQEEQATHFSTAIQSESARSGIGIPSSTGRIKTETNQFFLELSQNITVAAKEQPLVDFLYNLGSSNSLIRVRDLGLHTDPPRQQLMASVKLVASYQRKLPARSAQTSAPPPPPKTAPTTATTTKSPTTAPAQKTSEPANPAVPPRSPAKKIVLPNKKQL
jgi:hypothetical protein